MLFPLPRTFSTILTRSIITGTLKVARILANVIQQAPFFMEEINSVLVEMYQEAFSSCLACEKLNLA